MPTNCIPDFSITFTEAIFSVSQYPIILVNQKSENHISIIADKTSVIYHFPHRFFANT